MELFLAKPGLIRLGPTRFGGFGGLLLGLAGFALAACGARVMDTGISWQYFSSEDIELATPRADWPSAVPSWPEFPEILASRHEHTSYWIDQLQDENLTSHGIAVRLREQVQERTGFVHAGVASDEPVRDRPACDGISTCLDDWNSER